jgi:hypothetical protein
MWDLKLLEENTGDALQDADIGEDFQNTTPTELPNGIAKN